MAELCTRFLSDESSFYVDFHHAKGDEQASISRWRTHQPLGRVRELQFITALKVRSKPVPGTGRQVSLMVQYTLCLMMS